MRKTQGTHLSTLGSFSRIRSLDLKVQVSMPSITLINICEDGGVNAALYKVTNLRAFNVTFNEVLLLWSDNKVHSRCILMYEVQFCPGLCEEEDFKRINRLNDNSLSFHFSRSLPSGTLDCKEEVIGKFRVRASDYWNRTGPFSSILHYKNVDQRH
ncbi:alpha-L-iduronidase-like [Nilaparvata lugens]|uniref:alpha-L-iduronidase-like n=1 Tax=Nilaparvata lugens TaxID=108931 RepID=UPI00193CDFBC|nr:alpha-L-iduronidase-like [Nilaparvata lugens]